MNRIVSSLLVVAALAVPATALADQVRYLVLTSVRSGPGHYNGANKTLVVAGETATSSEPVRREYRMASNTNANNMFEDCMRMALIALNKPGKWFLDIDAYPQGSYSLLQSCTLVRNDPPPPQ